MLGAMPAIPSFGLCSSLRFIALALVFSGCSSDSSGSDTVPVWMAPSSDSPAPANAAAGSAEGAAEPAAIGSTPTSSTSEVPITPQRTQPPESSDTGSDENGAGSMGGTSGGDGSMETGAGGGTNPADGVTAARPSAACGSGGASLSFNLPNTLFSVPAAYDGTTPLPVVIAFHAAGNENTQLRGILGNTLDDEYIMLYPKSDGNGWSNGADARKVDAIFDALNATACYDENRVFATGHSSGAQFIVQRLCAGETRWRAVATVASSLYCSSWTPIPALVIHGIGDAERQAYGLDDGDGLKDIVPYRTSNGCGATFADVPVEGCTSQGVQVDPGCRDFDGCSEQTRWCQHNDPQYGTSHHGVPCFGPRVIKGFFDTYH
jgi:polyhydroxybutyrate depolymerase